MYTVTNTTTFLVVPLLLLRYNYMFRPSMLAIFRLYMRNLSKSYTNMCGEFNSFVGWGGCEISFCVAERGVDWGCFGDCVKIPFMSTYIHNTIAPQTQSIDNIVFPICIVNIKNVTHLQTAVSRHEWYFNTIPKTAPVHTPFIQHKTISRTHPTPQTVNSLHMLVQLIDKFLMYNLKMANIDGRNMQLYLSNSKHATKNIVVFVTIYICTIQLVLVKIHVRPKTQNCYNCQ